MELQLKDVQLALAKLLNHYPESGHNSNTLGRLAFDWFDLLREEGVTQPQFSAGIRHAVKTCRFFPKLADVLAGVANYRANPPAAVKPTNALLADETSRHDLTPEEIARNLERIEMIKLVFHPDPDKRVSVEEATAFVESVGHITEFSTMETKQSGGTLQ